MVSIAVVGVGRIGGAVAARLSAAGHRVTGYDIDPARQASLTTSGTTWASTLASAVAGADVVLTAVSGTAEIEQLVVESEVFLTHLRSAACWIDLTSTSFEVSRACSARAEARGIAHLDAPLGGGVQAVEQGQCTLYVGGPLELIERATPLLKTFASTLHHAGGHGAGHLTKLMINAIWFGQLALTAEVLLLAQRHGLRPSRLEPMLAGSAAESTFTREHLPFLLRGDYLEAFGLDRCVEELNAVEHTAAQAQLPHSLISAVSSLHREALRAFGPVAGELLAARWLEQQAGHYLADD